MRKGVDKFDLNDDEWMMVEDEFLQTAKLFTQHLHLEEYELLKAKMEEQRKNIDTTPRAVISNVKPSMGGSFKAKAKEQQKRQDEAIQDIVSGNVGKRTSFETPSKHSIVRHDTIADPCRTRRPRHSPSATDSEDLDAPKRSKNKPIIKPNTVIFAPKAISETKRETTELEASDDLPSKPSFSKPRTRISRVSRAKLLDPWDDEPTKPPRKPSTPSISNNSTSPQKKSHSNVLSPEPLASTRLSSSRTAKKPIGTSLTRKGRPNETKKKTKDAKDDITIPTFMF
jgi:hypothetical protein